MMRSLLLCLFALCSVCCAHAKAYGSIKYNEVAFKAGHNSYVREETLPEQLAWDSKDTWQGGCRSVELDIWLHPESEDAGMFTVHHDSPNQGYNLSYWFDQLREYKRSDPMHDPVTVILDIKSYSGNISAFPEKLDWYIETFLFSADSIFSPRHVLVDSYDLVQSVAKRGWPSLDELRDKFIFVLSGNKWWKKYYASHNPQQRLAFVDFDMSDSSQAPPPTYGDAVFFNFNLFSSSFRIWSQTMPLYAKSNLMTRGYPINDEDLWTKSLQAGVNILATDRIRRHEWAQLGAGAPFQRVPEPCGVACAGSLKGIILRLNKL